MDYRIFDLESRAPLDMLELHVLARAYCAAWRVMYKSTPENWHPMPMFNVVFEFVPSDSCNDKRRVTGFRADAQRSRKSLALRSVAK